MSVLPQDTIVALATPAGPGGRAIVRVSGPNCARTVRAVFHPSETMPARNRLCEGAVTLPGVHSPLPTTLYYFHAPHSYTGQDMAELHTLSCPPLVELLIAQLLQAGCRVAQPGEFTLRAFLAGKLDLTRAEAVHAVIDAGGRNDLRQALGQLAGGMTTPLAALREDLLDLLADVEAGLDFSDEDITFVDQKAMLLRVGKALAHVTLVGKQLDSRAVANDAFRVVLAGRPNAGKSSLFNALAGTRALVSEQPGTTRDYLTVKLVVNGTTIELVDTPGWQSAQNTIETQAQALGRSRQEQADLVLVCVEVNEARRASEDVDSFTVVYIATKCDLLTPPSDWFATSAHTGQGIAELRNLLAKRASTRPPSALAPSVSRCKHHVTLCLDHLRRAHAIVLEEDPPEILALELREALQQLGEMVGAVYTDDLLDRVFSRFCIGK
jgi:tRNA modification GTPase